MSTLPNRGGTVIDSLPSTGVTRRPVNASLKTTPRAAAGSSTVTSWALRVVVVRRERPDAAVLAVEHDHVPVDVERGVDRAAPQDGLRVAQPDQGLEVGEQGVVGLPALVGPAGTSPG